MTWFKDLAQQLEDQIDCVTPKRGDWSLADFTPANGLRIYWHFRDDADYWRKWEEGGEINDAAPSQWPYSGILLARPDVENPRDRLDFEDCIVVIDEYPTEKCGPESTWITLAQLIDSPNLVRITAEGGAP